MHVLREMHGAHAARLPELRRRIAAAAAAEGSGGFRVKPLPEG